MRREGRDVELGEVQDADLTSPVTVDDPAVLAFEGLPIEDVAFDQKRDPSIVAVAAEQRMVEIEKG